MSQFIVYPAIDLKDGKCVRLQQGDFNRETVYGDSPYEVAADFVEQGADWIHLVDLDGARDGKRVNADHILSIAKDLPINVQMGGGIRKEEDVTFYLQQGVNRIVIGSLAVSNPELTKRLISTYGDKIAIGLDARDGYIATDGWLNNSDKSVSEVGKYFAECGVEHFIFTDISKDGMMSGPNVEAILELADESGKKVIASGGVRNVEDLKTLKGYSGRNISGAIVGKALYTKEITLKNAINEVNQP